MKIIDVSTRGIHPFEGSKKITFKQNFNFIYGENSRGKSTLYKCILIALFDEGWEELKDKIYCVEKEPARVAVTFRNEKSAYRVTRDLTTGKFVLYRYDFVRKTFVEESRDPFTLSSLLDEKFQLLPYHLYKPLCTISHEMLLMKKEAEDVISVSSPSQTSSDEISRRKEDLLKELEFAKEVERMEEEISDKERELFNVNKEIEERENLKEEIKFLESEIEEKKMLEEFSSTAQDKLSQYKKLMEEKEKIESTHKSRIENLEYEIETIGEVNILKNKGVIGGAIPFFSSLLLLMVRNILTDLTGLEFFISYLHYVLLPVMLGGVMTIFYSLFRETSRKSKKNKFERELRELRYRYNKSMERIELELKKISAIMTTLNIHSPDELSERVKEYEEKKIELQEKKKRFENERKKISDDALRKKKGEIEDELNRLKEELQKKGSPSMAIHEIEEELRMIEEQQEPYSTSSITPQSEIVEVRSSLFEDFLEKLAEHSGTTQEEAITSLYDISIPLMRNVLGSDYDAFTFSDGKPGLRKVSGEFIDLDKVNQSTRDAVLIIMLMAFVKYNSEFRQNPLIMDDPFFTQDDKRKKVLFSALKDISSSIQVIIFSRTAEGKELADNYVEV